MTISRVRSNQTSVQVFPLFVALYVTGFLMEMVERWRFPDWTAAGVALSILTIALAKQRIVFLAFLILTTAHFLLFRFPEVANHINLLIFCNILLILGLGYSYLSRIGRKDFPAYFEALLSPVRLMLIVTYTVAGFHKFNYDFLNPEVSCIGRFLLYFWSTLEKPMFDGPLLSVIPVVLILFVIGVPAVLLLLRHRINRLPRWLLLLGFAVIAGVGTLLTAWSYLAEDLRPLIARQIPPVIIGISGLIVFWQLIEGPLLLIPRLQAIFLCFALLFHTYLGMIGFVDFQSLAIALLLAFVPRPVLETWAQERSLRLGSLRFDRVHAYVGLNLIAGLLTGIHILVTPLFEPSNVAAMQGVLFNGGVLILIWPILAGLLRATRGPRWGGVSVFHHRTPKFLYLLPLLLLLFGMTSYLGLRTAGNFSMFSNLRTEGATSNHILLGANPLKIWGYQEDTVRVLELDSEAADTGSNYDPKPMKGEQLPVVEFRKLISSWAKQGMKIPIAFEYQDKVFVSDNIAADPTWRPARWDWEMILLDFRVIQSEGPNRCRW
jgi:hypothetical protein